MMTQMTKAGLLAATALINNATQAAEKQAVDELIAKIKSSDDQIRGPAWQNAGPLGAAAVQALSVVMAEADPEVARAAKRALWKIVRHAGHPGAKPEQNAVAVRLIPLLSSTPTAVRREVLWMLSELGGDDSVPPVAALLTDQELREDARAALQRIPGTKALAALKAALKTVPEEYKPAIAVSLRARGVKVERYPSQKLVPTKKTNVTAVKAA